jgi:hypothetical protein
MVNGKECYVIAKKILEMILFLQCVVRCILFRET